MSLVQITKKKKRGLFIRRTCYDNDNDDDKFLFILFFTQPLSKL